MIPYVFVSPTSALSQLEPRCWALPVEQECLYRTRLTCLTLNVWLLREKLRQRHGTEALAAAGRQDLSIRALAQVTILATLLTAHLSETYPFFASFALPLTSFAFVVSFLFTEGALYLHAPGAVCMQPYSLTFLFLRMLHQPCLHDMLHTGETPGRSHS